MFFFCCFLFSVPQVKPQTFWWWPSREPKIPTAIGCFYGLKKPPDHLIGAAPLLGKTLPTTQGLNPSTAKVQAGSQTFHMANSNSLSPGHHEFEGTRWKICCHELLLEPKHEVLVFMAYFFKYVTFFTNLVFPLKLSNSNLCRSHIASTKHLPARSLKLADGFMMVYVRVVDWNVTSGIVESFILSSPNISGT